MSAVPGQQLASLLRDRNQVAPKWRATIAQAVVDFMMGRWESGHIHGDLALENILYDRSTQTLSFVDFGAVWKDKTVIEQLGPAGAACLDLGYIIYEAAVLFRDDLVSPWASGRRRDFISNLIARYIGTIDGSHNRRKLLLAIGSNAHSHLRRLNSPSAVRTLWYRIIKLLAARRIDTILQRVHDTGGRA
jgi:serine/threonine protein kinase